MQQYCNSICDGTWGQPWLHSQTPIAQKYTPTHSLQTQLKILAGEMIAQHSETLWNFRWSSILILANGVIVMKYMTMTVDR